MKIDPGSHVPIYLQIAERIGSAIAAGVYRPGESLPSQRALAVDVQVNPNTVQRAYEELVRQGIVYARRGKGLFVAERGADSAQTQAEDALGRALDEAIRTGRAAGMPGRTIRRLFNEAMDRSSAQGGKRR